MFGSASAPAPAPQSETDKKEDRKSVAVSDAGNREMKQRQAETASVASYWGLQSPKVTREDGTVWPWNCFMVRTGHLIVVYLFNQLVLVA